jgi:hypothetical protein
LTPLEFRSYFVPMPPDLVRDQSDRDAITLRAVIEMRMTLVAECRTCRRVSQVDVLEAIGRLGAAATIGMLRSNVGANCARRPTRIC